MPRDIPPGNGSLLVNFDQTYQLRDLYWPHMGQENHTADEMRAGTEAHLANPQAACARFREILSSERRSRSQSARLAELGVDPGAATQKLQNQGVARHQGIRRLSLYTLSAPPASVNSSHAADHKPFHHAVGVRFDPSV